MQPLFVAPNAHRRVEEFAQLWRGQQFRARAVAHNAPAAHQDHAFDLRQNIAQMMRHQHQSRSLLREPAQCLAQFALRRQVQRVRGLIKQQLSRPMHQRPRNQDAPLFSC